MVKYNEYDNTGNPLLDGSVVDESGNWFATAPTGLISCSSRVEASTGQRILFDDTTVNTLIRPTNADLAEIYVWGGSIVWDKRSGQAAVQPDGSVGWGRAGEDFRIELEGEDEIDNFQFIGMSGNAGRIEVHYLRGLKLNN